MRWAAALVVCLASLVVPSSAQTVVEAPSLAWCDQAGTSVWRVDRPAQNALARLTVEIRCIDNQPSIVRAKMETRCGRALCSWGYAEEAAIAQGRLTATFFTFTATRFLRAELATGHVSVLVENSYNQPGREPDTLSATMRLQR